MGRPTKHGARMKKSRLQESKSAKDLRLKQNRVRNASKRQAESKEERELRLCRKHAYERDRLSSETPIMREYRLTKHGACMKKIRLQESKSTKDLRLKQNRVRNAYKRQIESEEEHKSRLCRMRAYERGKLSSETSLQRQHRFNVLHKRLKNESNWESSHRLSAVRKRNNKLLINETSDERSCRLSAMRERKNERLLNETSDEHSRRLLSMRDAAQNRRSRFGEDEFESAINVYADAPCAICNKSLYPQQRTILHTQSLSSLLPNHLMDLGDIITCFRCSNNLKKRKIPAQASWNKMIVVAIPPELADLTEIEHRLLSRVVPFLKILKVQNRYSQDWCRGQVVLFAQDVVELAEQLPLQLKEAGIFIVAENLDNLRRSRQFQIDMGRLQRALQWLLSNNSLYRDVRSSFSNVIDILEITQVADESTETNVLAQPIEQPEMRLNMYIAIGENIAILRGSFNQASDRFDASSRGKQCTGIATVACAAFHTLDPHSWRVTDIDYILILGDRYYRDCIAARPNPDMRQMNIDYLAVTDLVPEVIFNNSKVNIEVEYEANFNGHIDNDNSNDGFPNLKNALTTFFRERTYGILTANSTSVAVHCLNSEHENISYWLLDSHSRGPKGYKAPSRGVACCMRFNSIEDLHKILRRNLYVKSGDIYLRNVYSLTPLRLSLESRQVLREKPDFLKAVCSGKNSSAVVTSHNRQDANDIHVICTTSMLRSVDDGVPDLQNVVSVTNGDLENNEIRLVDVHRKTAPPLNLEREKNRRTRLVLFISRWQKWFW